ncbi:MAG: thiol-disulfide oxidoreductase [Flavobacteriales bacterium CG_4_10_14_0_2_um_filter_32_8]|nr:MAG: thiol-disulfide oxidoreductase [Flavobacteriales bacterium CG_4_10_14_0_2_um_filter_32_8]PJB15989.1 MAG: thiol-disulfide oxidoreductase [Flavobacteriales bacterium CG_4_9_14_3_um_filter_32_8]
MLIQNNIILFDGDCNFCDYWIRFIIKRDKKNIFRFASLTSDFGKHYITIHQITIDSIILIENGTVFIKSTAALKISKHLFGLWKAAYFFIILPTFLRDFVYDVVAKNRYRWFSKRSCDFTSNETFKDKFLV